LAATVIQIGITVFGWTVGKRIIKTIGSQRCLNWLGVGQNCRLKAQINISTALNMNKRRTKRDDNISTCFRELTKRKTQSRQQDKPIVSESKGNISSFIQSSDSSFILLKLPFSAVDNC
jgi:hypothetical protein